MCTNNLLLWPNTLRRYSFPPEERDDADDLQERLERVLVNAGNVATCQCLLTVAPDGTLVQPCARQIQGQAYGNTRKPFFPPLWDVERWVPERYRPGGNQQGSRLSVRRLSYRPNGEPRTDGKMGQWNRNTEAIHKRMGYRQRPIRCGAVVDRYVSKTGMTFLFFRYDRMVHQLLVDDGLPLIGRKSRWV